MIQQVKAVIQQPLLCLHGAGTWQGSRRGRRAFKSYLKTIPRPFPSLGEPLLQLLAFPVPARSIYCEARETYGSARCRQAQLRKPVND